MALSADLDLRDHALGDVRRRALAVRVKHKTAYLALSSSGTSRTALMPPRSRGVATPLSKSTGGSPSSVLKPSWTCFAVAPGL